MLVWEYGRFSLPVDDEDDDDDNPEADEDDDDEDKLDFWPLLPWWFVANCDGPLF